MRPAGGGAGHYGASRATACNDGTAGGGAGRYPSSRLRCPIRPAGGGADGYIAARCRIADFVSLLPVFPGALGVLAVQFVHPDQQGIPTPKACGGTERQGVAKLWLSDGVLYPERKRTHARSGRKSFFIWVYLLGLPARTSNGNPKSSPR